MHNFNLTTTARNITSPLRITKPRLTRTPAQYEPQFGGYCAYGASRGKTVPVKIEAWQIVNGRLLMQYDLDVKNEFNKDPQGTLKKADENWPGLSTSTASEGAQS